MEPRRQSISVVAQERRRVVDRRRGSERRSTLDRRGRLMRTTTERPVEHVRNALQLLREVSLAVEMPEGSSEDLSAAIERLNRAVSLLDRQSAR